MASSIFERTAWKVAQKAAQKARIPSNIAKKLPLAKQILSGDIVGAAESYLAEKFGLAAGFGNIYGEPLVESQLLGGIGPEDVKEIVLQHALIPFAKKNLFFISTTDITADKQALSVNMMATEVSYTAFTATGEPTRIGSGMYNKVINRELTEISITMLEDRLGSVKRWFHDRAERMLKRDGTVGLPIDYLFNVDIIHGFIGDIATGSSEAFRESFLVSPTSIEINKSTG